ncbi:hypothetical protein COT97_03530 [Candidatus Falkowbacteria bacterium CG10_big_fil_rev_8_21_14_0_10_39_11]|uniref:Uncharacterized protein n=1 Tax=Candidatus Falkowbacteria bacterium CG10_big_fil_rev_8_21_14_0_10_39_11 TaxID=1974565 RepID=A0A2H0V6P7_9BACT|nr:MAG: hypothetical protein COT97_03530 [Candidatus Falkowbacteria bacterium CG10_big_fil_rev_8_21_14_0_10_39_11]
MCTGLSWVAWFFVLFMISPETTAFLGFVLFYLSLLIALFGTFSLLGFSVRFVWQKNGLWYKQLNLASRQAILLSVLVILTLIFQSFDVLWWWTMLLLLMIAVFVELYFITHKRGRRN